MVNHTNPFLQVPRSRENERYVGNHVEHRCPVDHVWIYPVELSDDVVDDRVLNPLEGIWHGQGYEKDKDEVPTGVDGVGGGGRRVCTPHGDGYIVRGAGNHFLFWGGGCGAVLVTSFGTWNGVMVIAWANVEKITKSRKFRIIIIKGNLEDSIVFTEALKFINT